MEPIDLSTNVHLANLECDRTALSTTDLLDLPLRNRPSKPQEKKKKLLRVSIHSSPVFHDATLGVETGALLNFPRSTSSTSNDEPHPDGGKTLYFPSLESIQRDRSRRGLVTRRGMEPQPAKPGDLGSLKLATQNGCPCHSDHSTHPRKYQMGSPWSQQNRVVSRDEHEK